MNKILKKDPLKLKFDTSSANLDCFIRKSSKQKSSEIEPGEKKCKKTRKKSKVIKQKNQEFQSKIFLEKILINVLNEEFVNPKQIKELIQNMGFSSGELSEKDNQKQHTKNEQSETLQTELFSIIDLKGRTDNSYKSIIQSCHKDLYLGQNCNNSTKLYTQDKTSSQTRNATPDNLTPEKSEELPMFTSIMQTGYQYQPPFYQSGYYQTNSLPLRKKKTVSGQQAVEYRIQLQKIEFDGRTTIMIRHIPNKYSEDMLLQEINKNHKLKFNFLYLPIDYYNTCNVGYAFVNFIHTKFIADFYREFNGKRWNKFNSEKICQLAYARIQGTTSLMDHFQNSHCMHLRDKKRPELPEETIKDINKIIIEQKCQGDQI